MEVFAKLKPPVSQDVYVLGACGWKKDLLGVISIRSIKPRTRADLLHWLTLPKSSKRGRLR